MNPLTPSELLACLNQRYATKQFQADALISDDAWDALEQSLVLTPSSFGLQPWKFIIVKNPGLRAELQTVSWHQPQTTQASHFVVFAARTDLEPADIDSWLECLATTQGKSAEDLAPLKGMISGFTASMTPETRKAWNTRQIYVALGQFMAAAAALGIDTCPMEGIDPAAYDRILSLENSGYTTIVACAVGYRSQEDKYAHLPKARFPRAQVVTHI